MKMKQSISVILFLVINYNLCAAFAADFKQHMGCIRFFDNPYEQVGQFVDKEQSVFLPTTTNSSYFTVLTEHGVFKKEIVPESRTCPQRARFTIDLPARGGSPSIQIPVDAILLPHTSNCNGVINAPAESNRVFSEIKKGITLFLGRTAIKINDEGLKDDEAKKAYFNVLSRQMEQTSLLYRNPDDTETKKIAEKHFGKNFEKSIPLFQQLDQINYELEKKLPEKQRKDLESKKKKLLDSLVEVGAFYKENQKYFSKFPNMISFYRSMYPGAGQFSGKTPLHLSAEQKKMFVEKVNACSNLDFGTVSVEDRQYVRDSFLQALGVKSSAITVSKGAAKESDKALR